MIALAEQRIAFTSCVAELLAYAEKQGLYVALDQVKRTQAEADANAASGAGISHSLHLLGLAVDLLVYRKAGPSDFVYCNLGTEPEYAELGAFWKQLDDSCCWGGDFSRPDYNHFSSTRGGVR